MLSTWLPVGQVMWAKYSSRRNVNPPSVNWR